MKKLLFFCLPLYGMQDKPEVKVKPAPVTAVTVIKMNEQGVSCDVKGCTFPVVSIWWDAESGSRAFRCVKHK